MSEGTDIIRVEGVDVVLGGREILKNIDLSIRKGEIFVLMGPSGCGKTTLLRCIMGLLVPSSGKILVHGEDIVGKSEEEMDLVRLKMGVSFQHGALFNSMSVIDNVSFPMWEKSELPRKEITSLARMKLDMVGPIDAANKLPAELSGGMRKRASIARAMALDPEILFLDEPTSGLDPITSAEIDELVRTLNQSFEITVVAVTHDIASAFGIGMRTAMMGTGRILDVSEPEEMRHHQDPGILNFIERRPPKGHGRGTSTLLEQETPS